MFYKRGIFILIISGLLLIMNNSILNPNHKGLLGENIDNKKIAIDYISKSKGILSSDLLFIDQRDCPYFYIQKHYSCVTIFDNVSRKPFNLLIDQANGNVIEDLRKVDELENTAYKAIYKKYDPKLFNRLIQANDTEILNIAIWVGRKSDLKGRSIDANVSDRVFGLLSELNKHGVECQGYDIIPSLTCQVTKKQLFDIENIPDIQKIYSIDDKVVPLLDTAYKTNRAPNVWLNLGISLSKNPNLPIKIAIVEPSNVEPGIPYLNDGVSRSSPMGTDTHTTIVADAAGSFSPDKPGMAPGAIILSAGSDTSDRDVLSAANWAINNGANVINTSLGTLNPSSTMEWLDRAFDYITKDRKITVVVSAGNRLDQYITAPGKAWNVITVGGSNDHNTPSWSDDTMYKTSSVDGSSYQDPNSVNLDREKPEVVAPGQEIIGVGRNNSYYVNNGTSVAAPQVTGLAALLMYRNPSLKNDPMAVKAIIMASAFHNIEGDSRLSEMDGSGAIDAHVAYLTAKTSANGIDICKSPCWWSLDTSASAPSAGSPIYRHFYVPFPTRVRVAISWWANADYAYAYDNLDTNFDLYVTSPSVLKSSVSKDNNYEIIEFYVANPGIYEIMVYKNPDTIESNNHVAIAWSAEIYSTYLPIINFSSLLGAYIQNNTAYPGPGDAISPIETNHSAVSPAYP